MTDPTPLDLEDGFSLSSSCSEDQTASDKEKVAFIAREAISVFYNQEEGEDQQGGKLQQTTLGHLTTEEVKKRRSIDPSLIDCKEPAGGKWKRICRGVYEDPLGVTHNCNKCIHKQRNTNHAYFCTVSPRTYLKTPNELKEDQRMAALKKPPFRALKKPPFAAEHGQYLLSTSQNTLSAVPPAVAKRGSLEQQQAVIEETEDEEVIAWTAADLKKKEPSSMRLSSFIEYHQRDDPDEESSIEDEGNNGSLVAEINRKPVKVWIVGIESDDEGWSDFEEMEELEEPLPPDDDEDLRQETTQLENSGSRKKIGITGRTLKKATHYLQEEKRTNGAISSAVHTYELLELFLELLCRQPEVTIPVRLYWHLIFPEPKKHEREQDKLKKIISLIISSSTTDAQVCLATQNLCSQDGFSLEYLLNTPSNVLRDLIHSAGRYKQNVKNMKKLARMVMEVYGGKIPEDLEEASQLPGVYTKIAAIFLKHACNLIQAIPCDRHVKSFSLFFGWVPRMFESNTEAVRFILEQRIPRAYWADFNEVIGGLAQLFSVQEHWDAIMHVASLPVFQIHSGSGMFASQITTLALQYNSSGRKKNSFDHLLTDFAKKQLLQAQAQLERTPAEYASARSKTAVEACRDEVAAAKSALLLATKTHEKAKKLVAKKPLAKAKKLPAKKAKKPPAKAKKPPAKAKKPPAKAKKPPLNVKDPPSQQPKITQGVGSSKVRDLVELSTVNKEAPSEAELDENSSCHSLFSLTSSCGLPQLGEGDPPFLQPFRTNTVPSVDFKSYEPSAGYCYSCDSEEETS